MIFNTTFYFTLKQLQIQFLGAYKSQYKKYVNMSIFSKIKWCPDMR